MLLDEPMAALDPLIRSSLQQELKSIFQRLNKTVLLVTHDVDEAIALADRILVMRHGAIAFEHRISSAHSASISRNDLLAELGVTSHAAA